MQAPDQCSASSARFWARGVTTFHLAYFGAGGRASRSLARQLGGPAHPPELVRVGLTLASDGGMPGPPGDPRLTAAALP